MKELNNFQYCLINGKLLKKENTLTNIDENLIFLKAKYWGICTSDLKSYNTGINKYFGHEILLEVVNPAKSNLKKGQLVVPLHTSPFDSSKKILIGFKKNYFFSEEEIKYNVIPLPKDIIFEKNFIFLDSFCCVWSAIKKLEIKKGIKNFIVILGKGFMADLFYEIIEKIYKVPIICIGRDEFFFQEIGICIDTTGSSEFINKFVSQFTQGSKLLLFSMINFGILNFSELREKNSNVLFSKFFNKQDLKESLNVLSGDLIKLDEKYLEYDETIELKVILDAFNNNRKLRPIIAFDY